MVEVETRFCWLGRNSHKQPTGPLLVFRLETAQDNEQRDCPLFRTGIGLHCRRFTVLDHLLCFYACCLCVLVRSLSLIEGKNEKLYAYTFIFIFIFIYIGLVVTNKLFVVF